MPDTPASAPLSPRGLRAGSFGALTSAGAGVGAAAPAYGLAAGLGWEAASAGPRTLLLAVLAFAVVLGCAWTQRELSREHPDCGTSFAWTSRAFGPRAGWLIGGWPRIAADLLVLAVQARVAGQYLFAVAGLNWTGPAWAGPDVADTAGLAGGLAWIAAGGWLGRRGVAVPARLLTAAAGISVAVLLGLAAAALASGRVAAPLSVSWLDPAGFASPGAFAGGLTVMVFAYWGWDTVFALGEETAGPARGVTSVLVLGGTVTVTVLAAQLAAGTGLGDPGNAGDALSSLGSAVFGGGLAGAAATRLLALAVLASAAAGAQARILTASRTAASMASAGALPAVFGRLHPRRGTPSFAAAWFAAAGAVLLAALNYVDGGNVLADAVTAAGFFIALSLAGTGFACFWVFRRTLTAGARNFWLRGVVPLACGFVMTGIGVWSAWFYAAPEASYSVWRLPPGPWAVGGVPGTAAVTALAGLAAGLPWILRAKDSQDIHTKTGMLPIAHPPVLRWAHARSRNPFQLTKVLTSVKVRTSPLTLCHSLINPLTFSHPESAAYMTRWSLRRHRHRAQKPVAGTVRLDPGRPELGPAPGRHAPGGYRTDGYAPPGPPGGYPAQPPGPAAPAGTPYPAAAGPQEPGAVPFPQTEFRQAGYGRADTPEVPGLLPPAGQLPPGFPSGLQPGLATPPDGAAAGGPRSAGSAWPGVMERFGLHLMTLAEQLRLSLDDLEADEADPDRLQKLYKVDHAVTRMRRASRDLRILGGRAEDELSGVDTSVLDVIRMALSAIDRYTQVTIGKMTDFAVLGYAADDVASLLAALLDNATRYSPGVTTISARLTDGGSVLFRIEDSGIGMDPDQVREVNEMLAGEVRELDEVTGRHTGFPVVHRIARRYSITVRLASRPAPNRGLLALVTLPPELLSELPEDALDALPPPPDVPSRESRVTELKSLRREASASSPSALDSLSSLDPEPAFPSRRPGASGAQPGYGSKASEAMAGVSRAQARRGSLSGDDRPDERPGAPDGDAGGTSSGLPRREPASLRGGKRRPGADGGSNAGPAPERSLEEQSASRRAFADDLAAFSQGSQSPPAPQDPSGKGTPS